MYLHFEDTGKLHAGNELPIIRPGDTTMTNYLNDTGVLTIIYVLIIFDTRLSVTQCKYIYKGLITKPDFMLFRWLSVSNGHLSGT